MANFKLSPLFLNNYAGEQPDWGFGDLSYFVYKRTYARIMDDGRQEEYTDTCRRVTEGVFNIQMQHCKTNRLPWKPHKAQKSAQEFFRRMWAFKFTPAGRGFWIMGTPMVDKIGSAALNSCGFTSTKDVSIDLGNSFSWAMDMLMLGVGIGFDTKGAGKVIIKGQKGNTIEHLITDDREGWVLSVYLLINSFMGGQKYTFIYDDIRPAGELIRGFGGTASGSGPLIQLHKDIEKILSALVGLSLTSVAIVDLMNFVGKCVVAGNVRRSAEIAVGEMDDEDYVTMKDYTKYPVELSDRRWASNNSVFANTYSDFKPIAPNIALNGEPGLIFLENAKHYGRLKDGWHGFESDKYDNVAGVNPCKPLNSLILTPDGYITFRQALEKDSLLVGTPTGGWCEASKPFKTGENRRVWRVKLSNGSYLYGTGNHRHKIYQGDWKRIDELEIGDVFKRHTKEVYTDTSIENEERYRLGLLAGWTHGDGSFTKRKNRGGHSLQLCFGNQEFDVADYFSDYLGKRLFEHQQTANCRLVCSNSKFDADRLLDEGWNLDKTDLTWLYGKDKDFKLGFLKAVFTADGSVRKPIDSVELYSTRRSAIEVVSNLLKEFGIPNTITKHANEKSYIAKDGKVRNNATCWKISTRSGNYLPIGFMSKIKTAKLQSCKLENLTRMRDKLKVVEIDKDWSIEDVYDITVYNDEHAFIDTGVTSHNCGEQTLEDKELCTLVETYPANHDSAEDYLITLKFAYMYAKTVTLVPTHDERTNSVMMRNRRIGCSMSGIQQAITKFGLQRFLSEFCDNGYKEIKSLDRIYSRWLCVPRSIKTTTVKPSGSVSILAGATPGVHWTHSEYHMRTVRCDSRNELVNRVISSGYRVEYERRGTGKTLLLDLLEQGSYISTEDKEYIGSEGYKGDNEHYETISRDIRKDPYIYQGYVKGGGTVVIYFPVKEKDFTKSKFDVSIWEQLAIVREMQYVWSDNSVSVTVTIREHEKEELHRAIEIYAPYVKTLSFLPLTNHRYDQAPYQESDAETINDYIRSLTQLDLSNTQEKVEGSKFCTTDSCTV